MLQIKNSFYNTTKQRLFIDSSKQSFKCLLLRNRNLFSAVPIGHSVTLHEERENTKKVTDLLQNHKQKLIIGLTLKLSAD